MDHWLHRLSQHGNGIALIFARTDTKTFFNEVWNKAHALYFLKGRLSFYHVDGTQAKDDSGAPSVLVAYGENNQRSLKDSKLSGKYIKLR